MPSVPRRHSCAAASAHRRTSSAALARELSTTYSRPRSSDPWLRSGCGALILAAQHLGRAPAGRPARHYTSARRERGRGFNGVRHDSSTTTTTPLRVRRPAERAAQRRPPPSPAGPRRPERLTLPTSLSPHEPLLPVGGARTAPCTFDAVGLLPSGRGVARAAPPLYLPFPYLRRGAPARSAGL